MTKQVFEVYWETKSGRSVRRYSRYFNHEILATPFWAKKKAMPSVKMAFCREIAVEFDAFGHASEIRFVRLLCAHLA